MVKVKCEYCKKDFYNFPKRVADHKIHFCTIECLLQHKRTITTVNCGYCNNPIKKLAKEIRYSKSGFVFCNRSCAAKYNNSIKPKRHKEEKPKVYLTCDCGNQYVKYSKCKFCKLADKNLAFGKRLLKDFDSTYARHRYQAIRHHAHRVAKMHGLSKQCTCGYNTYVELCHIKGISTFTLDTSLSEINDPKNLIYLCPTHHWELDHGILKLSG